MESDEAVEPTPEETVTLRARDFEMLQHAVSECVEDVTALASLLGVKPPDGMAPYLVMRELLLPRVAHLITMASKHQRMESEASAMVQRAEARFGPAVVGPDGRMQQKVGQRVPGLLTVPQMSRRERREFERQQRRG